jgi:hypothetical protein
MRHNSSSKREDFTPKLKVNRRMCLPFSLGEGLG